MNAIDILIKNTDISKLHRKSNRISPIKIQTGHFVYSNLSDPPLNINKTFCILIALAEIIPFAKLFTLLCSFVQRGPRCNVISKDLSPFFLLLLALQWAFWGELKVKVPYMLFRTRLPTTNIKRQFDFHTLPILWYCYIRFVKYVWIGL